MNQDERLDAIIGSLSEVETLSEMPVAAELAEPSSFLKVLKARHLNWESERFRKVFGMRFSVRLPPIEQLNTIFYPRDSFGFPIFIFFMLVTKRRVIAHINLNCPFDDDHYREKWVQPLVQVLKAYQPFEAADRYPEWMKKYRNEATIYGLFDQDRLQDLNDCCFEYMQHYTTRVAEEAPETDGSRLRQIRQFHEQWVDDIRTQDKAQGMMAKMIGKRTARRIFYEVTT